MTLWRALSDEVRFALVLLIATVLVGPVSIYGGEMLIRTELFSLPPLAMMIVATAESRGVLTAVAAVLTVMAPLHIVTHYGNELYDYVSPGEIAGFKYVADHLAPAKIYGGFPGGGFLKSATLRWRNSTVPNAKPSDADRLPRTERANWGNAPGDVYVAFSRGDVAAATLFYNHPHLFGEMQRLVAHNPHFQAVYVTPEYSIYRWLPPPPQARARQLHRTGACGTSTGSTAGGATRAGGRRRKTHTPTR